MIRQCLKANGLACTEAFFIIRNGIAAQTVYWPHNRVREGGQMNKSDFGGYLLTDYKVSCSAEAGERVYADLAKTI